MMSASSGAEDEADEWCCELHVISVEAQLWDRHRLGAESAT